MNFYHFIVFISFFAYSLFFVSQSLIASSRLAKLTAQRSSETSSSSTSASNHVEGTVGLRMLMKNFGKEETASEPFVFMPSMVRNGIEVS